MSRSVIWRIVLLVFWLFYVALLTLLSISKSMGWTMVNSDNVPIFGMGMFVCLVGILVAAVVLAGRLHRTQGGWGLWCFLLAPVFPLVLALLPEARAENIGRPLAWLEKPWLPQLLRGLSGLAALSFLLGCFGPAFITPWAWTLFVATALFAPAPTLVHLERQGYIPAYGVLGSIVLPFLVPAVVSMMPKKLKPLLATTMSKQQKPLSRYWKCPYCKTVLVKLEDAAELMSFVGAVSGSVTCATCRNSIDRNEVYSGKYDTEVG